MREGLEVIKNQRLTEGKQIDIILNNFFSYTFCAFAALFILNATQKINLSKLYDWCSKRQLPLEGGFNGRTNKLVDACYTFW
jgi:prenyltransferase beta subunit